VLPTAPAQVAALVRQGAACDTSESARGTIVHVIPPPETHIPLARLDQSPVLLRLGYDQARTWLEGNPLPGAPVPDVERGDLIDSGQSS